MPAVREPKRNPRTGDVVVEKDTVKKPAKVTVVKKLKSDDDPKFIITVEVKHKELLLVRTEGPNSDMEVTDVIIRIPDATLELVMFGDQPSIQLTSHILKFRNRLAFDMPNSDGRYRANALDISMMNIARELATHSSVDSFFANFDGMYKHGFVTVSWELV